MNECSAQNRSAELPSALCCCCSSSTQQLPAASSSSRDVTARVMASCTIAQAQPAGGVCVFSLRLDVSSLALFRRDLGDIIGKNRCILLSFLKGPPVNGAVKANVDSVVCQNEHLSASYS